MEYIAKFVKNSSGNVYLTHDDNSYEWLEEDELEVSAQYKAWEQAGGELELVEALDDYPNEKLITLTPEETPA